MANLKDFQELYRDLSKINSIDDIKVVDRKIPIGYNDDGTVNYDEKVSLRLYIDYDKDLTWLDNIDDGLLIQIGDTFYKKGGACFKYEYLNQSSDYYKNLTDQLKNDEVYIFFKGKTDGQNC